MCQAWCLGAGPELRSASLPAGALPGFVATQITQPVQTPVATGQGEGGSFLRPESESTLYAFTSSCVRLALDHLPCMRLARETQGVARQWVEGRW